MKTTPLEIYGEYREAADFKSSLGKRGLYEQNAVNERFYIGDQWYGAKCGNERPLVRHNVIKRIGDYKMSQILSSPLSVAFSAEGVPYDANRRGEQKGAYTGELKYDEINDVMESLSDYFNVTAERIGLDALEERALRNAYITGTGIIYTYWDGGVRTGVYADPYKRMEITGDIACEVLDIENVYFGDPYAENVQKQPYIIISSCRETADVLREAAQNGADRRTLEILREEECDGKITVLTKLYKEYTADGSYKIKCVKVTEHTTVRRPADTGLRLYPLAAFQWERRGGIMYGESEITYLIPNQIAINRMITANVWSAMTSGMPMMVINGDTVPQGITNEPGQIIKVFGSNEDVDGAVKYVAPPDFSKNFENSVQSLINNTLTQSGANEVALGDSRADNATALITMRDAAIMPLNIAKTRFYAFAEEISRIWADFWIACYGRRKLKIRTKNSVKYIPFDASRYAGLIINATVDVGTGAALSDRECVNTLITLFEKGIINRREFLERVPDGIIPDRNGLLAAEEETENERE